ncbi:MAG: AAA family ATPase [Pseudomonadota bacterium]
MFLRSIQLKNFRGFTDQSLSFVETNKEGKESIRKSTILLGQNGTGKSNLLKAIGLVLAGRSALPSLMEDVDGWVQYRKKRCQVDATLQTQAGELREITLHIERGMKIADVIDENHDSLSKLEDALEYTERSYFTVGYGASRRLNTGGSKSRKRTRRESDYRSGNLASLFSSEAQLTPIEEWAMDLDYQRNRSGLAMVRQVFSKFLRNVKFEKIDKKTGTLLFRTPDGLIPMSNLSDGYQNVAGWVGDLLYRISVVFDDYTDPLSTRGVLIIDELDLHLHPKWQRDLIGFLKNQLPNMQVIATTHSPITAQQARMNELWYVERRRSSCQIEQFEGDPSKLLLHQLVMSDLFDISSDESVAVEKIKNRYKTLKGIKSRTARQDKEMAKLKVEISEMPVHMRTNTPLSSQQMNLLLKIQKEMGS